MKAYFLTFLIVAALLFVIYKQREKITGLETALAAQTERADKLQEMQAKIAKPATLPIQSTSSLSQPATSAAAPVAPSPSPPPAKSGSWMWGKSTLDPPGR